MSLGFLIPSSPSSWPITHFHLDFTLSWGIVVMSGFYPFLLIFVCFEQFHYDWNQLLSFIPLIPLGGTHFYNFFGLHKLTKKEPHGVFFQLFSDSQNMKILPSTRVFKLVKINEKTSTQWKLSPFLDWDILTMKNEYLSWTWIRGSLKYYFLPFQT